MNIFDDINKAVNQLTDRRFQKVLWRGIGLSVVLLVFPFLGITSLLSAVLPETLTIPFVGEMALHGGLMSVANVIVLIALSFLMFPVASLIIGMFLEEISDAVEAKHYPELPPVDRLSFTTTMFEAVKFVGLMIFANVLALIAYLIFSPFALFIFWALNGFLMGREYFELVASRRIGVKAAKALRKKHFTQIWMAGVLVAIPLSVPIVNILVPLLGVAVFTHQFHRLKLLA